jgi:hypothetical protein
LPAWRLGDNGARIAQEGGDGLGFIHSRQHVRDLDEEQGFALVVRSYRTPNAELRTSHAPFAEAARLAVGTWGMVV